MPNFSGPLSASPDSLTMTRRNFGFAIGIPRPSPPFRLNRAIAFAGETQQPIRLVRAGKRCDLAAEIAARTTDALAECEANKSGDLDRRSGLSLGLLQCLRDALFVVEDKALIQEADVL